MLGVNDPRFDGDLPDAQMHRIACGDVSASELRNLPDRDLCNGITLLLLTPGCIAFRFVVSRLVCWYTNECSGNDEHRLMHELERQMGHASVLPHQRDVIGELIRRFRARRGV